MSASATSICPVTRLMMDLAIGIMKGLVLALGLARTSVVSIGRREVSEAIKEFIRRRRRQLIVHRVLYYCYDKNIIPDRQYDLWNAELTRAEADHPELAEQVEFHDCSPTRTVGSSYLEDYPVWAVRKAQQLILYKREE